MTYIKRKLLPNWIFKKDWQNGNRKVHNMKKDYEGYLVHEGYIYFVKNVPEKTNAKEGELYRIQNYKMVVSRWDIIEFCLNGNGINFDLSIVELIEEYDFLKQFSTDERAK